MSKWLVRGGVVAAVAAGVAVLLPSAPLPTAHPRGPRGGGAPLRRSAVVVGATGATGQRLVGQLLASDAWGSVTALVRQPSSVPVEGLTEVVVPDMLTMTDGSVFEGADVLFNCIGTTRGGGHSPSGRRDEGGAHRFVQIEVGITRTVSTLAAAAGVKAVALVTSDGANAELFKVRLLRDELRISAASLPFFYCSFSLFAFFVHCGGLYK